MLCQCTHQQLSLLGAALTFNPALLESIHHQLPSQCAAAESHPLDCLYSEMTLIFWFPPLVAIHTHKYTHRLTQACTHTGPSNVQLENYIPNPSPGLITGCFQCSDTFISLWHIHFSESQTPSHTLSHLLSCSPLFFELTKAPWLHHVLSTPCSEELMQHIGENWTASHGYDASYHMLGTSHFAGSGILGIHESVKAFWERYSKTTSTHARTHYCKPPLTFQCVEKVGTWKMCGRWSLGLSRSSMLCKAGLVIHQMQLKHVSLDLKDGVKRMSNVKCR